MFENSAKKKRVKARGSIVLELIAVILAAALIFSLTYPSRLWKEEEQRTEICRDNLWHIYFAEITYMEDQLVYTDTLDKVVDFIMSDTTGEKLRRFTGLDSILGGEIINMFKQKQDIVTITMDSVFGEGPDSVVTKNVEITVSALMDSMLAFADDVDMDTTEAFVLDSLRSWEEYSTKIDSMAFMTLDQVYSCPTAERKYLIDVNNDTIPKMITISCPIDSTDIERVENDFKLSFLGGLKIENHGALDNGEKSW